MLAIAKIALYIWVPFVLLVFSVMKPRRAVIFAYIAGWLFLPMLSINFSGIPDLTKITASSFGILLGASMFDYKTLLKFRPSLFDLPMALWCVAPLVTSVTNDAGWYDGASNLVGQLGIWGIPYFIGRVYFKDLQGFKELGIGIIIGAIVYLPFSYMEMITSPLLHKWTYGFVQHSIAQAKRWGFFRPMVFMQSSLALAMYMTTATLVAVALWSSGSVKKLFGVPMFWIVAALFVTQILCKTVAATAFLFAGIATLYWIKWLGKSGFIGALPFLVLAAIPPTYMFTRTTEIVTRDDLIELMTPLTSADRLVSLDVRLKAETLITARALEAPNPLWGWGRWDPRDPQRIPWRVVLIYDKPGIDRVPVRKIRDIAVTDGLWIVTIGQFGIIGVGSLTLTIILPIFVLWWRIPLRFWSHPAVATAAAMALLLVLHMLDNLLNGMINSIYMLALGGLCGVSPSIRKIYKRYGLAAAEATLNNALLPADGQGQRGFPMQQPAYGMPNGYPQPAGYGMPPQAAYGQMTPQMQAMMQGFPSIAGLQAGPTPRRRR